MLDREIFGDVAPVERPGVDDLVAEAVDEPDGLAGGELDGAAAPSDLGEIGLGTLVVSEAFGGAVNGSAVESFTTSSARLDFTSLTPGIFSRTSRVKRP